MRAAAALAPSDKTGLQCYVGDPILALKGTRPATKRQCARVLLLWSALNFKLAWSKASRGPKVEWIGATYEYYWQRGQVQGVDVTIGPDKIAKMEERAQELLQHAMVERSKVKEFAGFTSWISSVIKAVRPYSRMLWAAAMAKPAGRETWGRIY